MSGRGQEQRPEETVERMNTELHELPPPDAMGSTSARPHPLLAGSHPRPRSHPLLAGSHGADLPGASEAEALKYWGMVSSACPF